MRVVEAYPGTLCVCVNEMNYNSFVGEFYHRFDDAPVGFIDFFQMVLKAEKIFDFTGAPMAFQSKRTFSHNKSTDKKGRISELSNINNTVNHKGNRATFIVNVQYRQHSSWQGKITWVEGKQSSSFRSVLELVKLIDSATEGQNFAVVSPEEEGSKTVQLVCLEGE